jgi:hypothetical protein
MSSGPQYAEGTHVGQIVGQGLSKAKTGNYQVVLGVKILGLPNDDGSYDPHKFQNVRTIYLTITQGTLEFLMPKMEAIGFNGSSWGQMDPAHPQNINLIGTQVDLWCKHETGQDDVLREKWDISTGPKGIVIEALSPKDIRQLDSLFGKALKPKAVSGQRTATKPVTKQPPLREDSDPGITDADLPDNMQAEEEDPIPF